MSRVGWPRRLAAMPWWYVRGGGFQGAGAGGGAWYLGGVIPSSWRGSAVPAVRGGVSAMAGVDLVGPVGMSAGGAFFLGEVLRRRPAVMSWVVCPLSGLFVRPVRPARRCFRDELCDATD